MFSNLMKVFHDGILITENDNILYQNKVIQDILEVNRINSVAEDLNIETDRSIIAT